MSTVTQNAVQDAEVNTQALVEQNDMLKSECAVFGTVRVEGPCGVKTLPNTDIKIDGKSIKNTNVKGGNLTWYPQKAHVTTSCGDVKNLGSKFCNSFSTRVSRILNNYGVSLDGFTIVPVTRLQELTDDIQEAEADFWKTVDDVSDSYDAVIEMHKQNNPEIAGLIDKYRLDRKQFVGRYVFKKPRALSVMPFFAEDKDDFKLDAADALYREIAAEASKIYSTSFAKRDEATQKIRSGFLRMRAKLMSLAFLDEGVIRVVDSIDDILGKLPTKGKFGGHMFSELARWCLVMASEDTLKLHASGDNQMVEPEPEPEPELQVFGDDSFGDFDSLRAIASNCDQPIAKPIPAIAVVEQPQSDISDIGWDW